MTDAADIRRAVERCGVRGFARRAGCPPAAVQRLVKRGAYPERGPHGEGMRAAVLEVPAESEPPPESLAELRRELAALRAEVASLTRRVERVEVAACPMCRSSGGTCILHCGSVAR